MAVNVSGRQASDSRPDRARALEVVADAGIDPQSLCLEMTERVLIDADDEVVADLQRLTAEVGCRSRSTTSAPATRR